MSSTSCLEQDSASLRAGVAERTWWHQIDLGAGIITSGIDDSAAKLETPAQPASLANHDVLDIGAYDGF